jgi:hypothetical protein
MFTVKKNIERTSMIICNNLALAEVLRRKANNNFAKCKKENRETTKKSVFETDQCFIRLKAGLIYIIIITFFYVHENTPHITLLGLKCVYK